MGATVLAELGTGATVSWASAEGGIKFNREDTATGTTPVPIPGTTGTNFSWIKNLVLYVTATASTNISNRRINYSGSLSGGLFLYFKAVAVASYAQAAAGNMPAAAATNGPATPTGYTQMTGTAQVYDASSVSAGATGPNGQMCVVVAGVDSTFAGGAGSATALPSLIVTYDEQ